jgi:hypothetical protein
LEGNFLHHLDAAIWIEASLSLSIDVFKHILSAIKSGALIGEPPNNNWQSNKIVPIRPTSCVVKIIAKNSSEEASRLDSMLHITEDASSGEFWDHAIFTVKSIHYFFL